MKKVVLSNRPFGECFDFNRSIFEEMIAVNMSNPLTMLMHNKSINEGLVMTYPYETMKRYVCQYFNIPSFYFHDINNNGVKCCAIDIPLDKYEDVKKAMNLCGYFESVIGEFDDFIRVHFEPKFEEKIEQNDFLYHLTHHSNVAKIRRIGLCPSDKNTFFKYPSRVYFLTKEASKEEMESLARMLNMSHKKDFKDGLYIALKVDLSKVGGDVNFHIDPNLEHSLYTTNNIRRIAIMDDYEVVKV